MVDRYSKNRYYFPKVLGTSSSRDVNVQHVYLLVDC